MRNRWFHGNHSRSAFSTFHGAGQDHTHRAEFKADADSPPVFAGKDNGPTPIEYVLHAIASCLTAGIVNLASARSIRLDEVSSMVEGDVDMQGALGISKEVRNGFSAIRVRLTVSGEASQQEMQRIVEQSCARSVVLDVVTNGVAVDVEVNGRACA